MAVFHLFGRRFTHGNNGDVEMQPLAGEWMVAVHRDRVALHGDHGHDIDSVFAVCLELHAGGELLDASEQVSGDHLNELFVAFAVGILGLDVDLQVVTGGFARKRTLESGDHMPDPMEIGQRLSTGRGIDHGSVIASQRIIDRNDRMLTELHKTLTYGTTIPWSGMPAP